MCHLKRKRVKKRYVAKERLERPREGLNIKRVEFSKKFDKILTSYRQRALALLITYERTEMNCE